MYIPKGTTISYIVIKVRCKDIEKEMILVDKDVFESLITKLGFEKKKKEEEQVQTQEQVQT